MTTQHICSFCLWLSRFSKTDTNCAALFEFYNLRGGSYVPKHHNKLIFEALKNEPMAININLN